MKIKLSEVRHFQKIAGLLNENEIEEAKVKWTLDQAKAAYDKEYTNFTPETLANFSYDNFSKITGLPQKDRDQEGHFPEEIVELCYEYGITEFDDDFVQSFGYK